MAQGPELSGSSLQLLVVTFIRIGTSLAVAPGGFGGPAENTRAG